jgi:hypothetical protein
MYTRNANATREPHGVVRDDQPDAREGQAGRCGETEGFVVPRKPANAGGSAQRYRPATTRNLIQQRLEEIVVAPVDDEYVGRC